MPLLWRTVILTLLGPPIPSDFGLIPPKGAPSIRKASRFPYDSTPWSVVQVLRGMKAHQTTIFSILPGSSGALHQTALKEIWGDVPVR